MKQFFVLQIAIVLLVVLVTTIIAGTDYSYSVVLGGGVCIVTHILVASILFSKTRRAHAAKNFLMVFYAAELVKILVTIVLFALIFYFIKINLVGFILGYAAGLLSFWVSLLLKN